MKNHRMSIFLFSVLFILSNVCGFAYAAETFHNDQAESGYLFIQSAKKAVVTKTSMIGHYKITLYRVDPWVVYFSNRPKQDRGMMPLDEFLTMMKEQANQYKPKGLNAAIVSIAENHDHTAPHSQKMVFTLSNPTYQKNSSSLSYDAECVIDNQKGEVTFLPEKMTLKKVELFIDACIGCVKP